MSVEIIADKQSHNLHKWNYNRKINQMKHLLINEACFITSSVNDKKKNFNTAAAFKKVELRTMFLSSVNR